MCVGESGETENRKKVREREERLIGILVLCRGRDARKAEIISLVELNLNGRVHDPQFFKAQVKPKQQRGSFNLNINKNVMQEHVFSYPS